LPPDINQSGREFTVSGDAIQFGLVAVKNVGESAIDAIIEAREEREFSSLFDFCERVDLKKVNKRVIESLVKCGAFDGIGAKRAQLVAAVEDALDYGQRVQKERLDPQMGLFDLGENPVPVNVPNLPQLDEWDPKTLLAIEKESLGFYFSGHPLNRYEALLEKYTNANAVSIKDFQDGDVVRIGGLVQSIKPIKTKRGESMAFVAVEDMHGSIEVIVFSRVYASVSDLLVTDQPILVQGQLQREEQTVRILAETIIPMDKAEETWTASIHLNVDIERTDRDALRKLHDILKRYPGTSRAYLHLISPEKTDSIIELPDALKLKVSPALTREIQGLFGYQALETRCLPARNGGNGIDQARNARRRDVFYGS
jgi:DNA polymerase-3 subunit alpha